MSELDYLQRLDASACQAVNTLEGDLLSGVGGALEQAQAVFDALPEEGDLPRERWRVKSLGRLPTADSEKNDEKAAALPGACAAMVASLGGPFALTFETREDDAQCHILLQAEGLNCDSAARLLRGVYGRADLNEWDTGPDMRYATASRCVCAPLFQPEEDKALEEPLKKEGQWLAQAANAAIGSRCCVRAAFFPIAREWLEEKIQTTLKLMDVLSKNLKSSVQVSATDNFSYQKKEAVNGLPGMTHKIGRDLRDSLGGRGEELEIGLPSGGNSVSRTFEREYNEVAMVYEALKKHLKRLQWLKRGGAWGVSLSIQADSANIRTAAERILSAQAEEAGYRCMEWIRGDTALYSGQKEQVSLLLPSNRAGCFFFFPQSDLPGFQRLPLADFEVNAPVCEEADQSRAIGQVIWNGRALSTPFFIPRQQLNRHAFICGMTGSGKTNTVCALLQNNGDQLPFMVIEPVKGEYRSLKGRFPSLEVYTMEAGSTRQLHTNPFWFPEGGNLQYHIDSLRAVIASSFELTAAMPNILEQCLTRVYVNLGWNVAQGTNSYSGKLRPEMLYPTFSMLCREIDEYIDQSTFADEVKSNYKGALLARLQSFTCGTKGILLDRQTIPPFERWAARGASCVIELEALANDAEKAIVMGVLLSQYFQCVKLQSTGDRNRLRHIIVIEEAHHLFKDVKSSGSAESNESRMHLVEMLSNMLAEIRAYGEGIFIVDQSPTSISPHVIKNTAVKIVHRVDYAEDLRILQHALLLDEKDMNAPSELTCGQALIRFGAMRKPMHVQIQALKETSVGGKTEAWTEGLRVQHLIDVLQITPRAAEAARNLARRFINHLLFDDGENVIKALDTLRNKLLNLAVAYGADMDTFVSMMPWEYEYALKTFASLALMEAYPMQGLLRGKMEMMEERFFSLQYAREEGIRQVEWEALRTYCENEVYPGLAASCRNSHQADVQSIAAFFPDSETRVALSPVLWNMRLVHKELVKNDEAMKNILDWEANKAVSRLCARDFLITPMIADDLWSMYRAYAMVNGQLGHEKK